MANMITPGYDRSSLVNQVLTPYDERVLEFRGLNQRHSIEEGEMSDMKNLTSDNYPLLTPRKLRGEYEVPSGVKPLKIMTKFDRIAMIGKKSNDAVAFFYDGTEITSVTGLTEETEMVSINTKICFFPQRTYLTLVRGADSVTVGAFGNLGYEKDNHLYSLPVTLGSSSTTIQVVRDQETGGSHQFVKGDAIDIEGTIEYNNNHSYTSDGTKVAICTQSDNTGADVLLPDGVWFTCIKKEGSTDLWLVATSTSPFVAKTYYTNSTHLEMERTATLQSGHYATYFHWSNPKPVPTTTKEWYTIPTTADPVKVALAMNFGTPVTVSCEVKDVTRKTIIVPKDTFAGLPGGNEEDIQFSGYIRREIPNVKHVVEWNNRLWGCKDDDNTIYACKLGDPTNWKFYQGTSLDSYYAQQGTDGNWTGSAAYSAHLIFFKQNSMTKIYGTSPSSFQVTNTVCYGVEEGSNKSVVIINDAVFYRSTEGIMAYEGGTPYSISNKLKTDFHNVVAGTDGRKYYASIENEDGTHDVLVLDVERAVWHKEDDARFRDCCTYNGKMYFISDDDSESCSADHIYIVNPDTPTEKLKDREWMAVFGDFDENIENRKIFSKLTIRFITKPGAVVTIYIRMDDGEWQRVKQFGYARTGGHLVPIVPRRCDRYAIKIVGKGECEIKSITRRYRRGSDKNYDNRL